jgi:hypothetical protein
MGGLNISITAKTWLLLAIMMMLGSSVHGENLTIRSSEECCKRSPNFVPGSEAFLISGNEVVGHSKIKREAPFIFKNVKKGLYDLMVVVEGYYPIKYTDVEIGEGGVFDFELIADLKPLSANLLEGWLTLRFKKGISDKDIIKRLKKWHLEPRQKARREPGSQPPEFEIEKLYDCSEVRASYDKKKNLREIMAKALADPEVVDCTPTYF